MKKFGLVILATIGFFALIIISRQLWGGIAAVAVGFLVIAVSIVFVAVFSKAYKNWPI